MTVVEHRTVHHARMVFRKVLQVLVVGSDHAEGLFLPELLQHGLCDGSADGGLRSAAELVDQQQRLSVGLAHHLLHVHQVTRVGREVVLDALLVADVYQDVMEKSAGASVADRYGQTALEHVLQQSGGLQTDRLTTCVRTRDDQDALLLSQRDLQRHHLLALLLQRELQQWVDGSYPVDVWPVFHFGLEGLREFCQLRLGVYQVDACQELVRLEYLFHMWAHLVAEYGQDAYYLAALLSLQLAHFVVGLHHFRRFDEDRLTCGRLVVHDTVDAPFHLRCYGYHQSSVAHGRGGVLIDDAVLLCRVQYSI